MDCFSRFTRKFLITNPSRSPCYLSMVSVGNRGPNLRALETARVDYKRYTRHSFRSGAATTEGVLRRPQSRCLAAGRVMHTSHTFTRRGTSWAGFTCRLAQTGTSQLACDCVLSAMITMSRMRTLSWDVGSRELTLEGMGRTTGMRGARGHIVV